MKYNFRYVDEELDNEDYQIKVKTHKHHIKNNEDNDFKHLKKEETKKMKKFRKEKYELEDE